VRDPYNVLGVSRGADQSEIKKAFRRLAKRLHPDANRSDPKAAARFAEINAAYELLGEEAKRKAFDRGEIDAEGKPRFQGFSGFSPGAGARSGFGGFDGDTVFETFSFGPEGIRRTGGRGGASRRGSFDDLLGDLFGASGGTRTGGGDFEGFAGGTSPRGADAAASLTITLAEAAHGTRKRVRLPTGKKVEVTVPGGIADGQQIRLRGLGFPAAHGAAGDALVTIHVAPHSEIKPDGEHLRAEVAISLDEAILGGTVRVPTLDGAVDLKIPPWTSGGRVFRLKGKGLPAKAGGMGDLLVTVRIELPKEHNAELEALARRLRE
jgi:DnaJ-class molecular chaperone